VRDVVVEPLRAQAPGSSAGELDRRAAALLTQVGLTASDGAKYPHQFSGGQRQRISIARALSTEPQLLVCDEPTSALDVSVQAQVLNLMRDLQRRLGLTYVFISHNLAVVHHIADRVGVMYLGRIVELAPTRTLFLDAPPPVHADAARRGAGPRDDRQGAHRGRRRSAESAGSSGGCAFHPRCPYAAQRCREARPALIAHGATRVACHAVEEGRLPRCRRRARRSASRRARYNSGALSTPAAALPSPAFRFTHHSVAFLCASPRSSSPGSSRSSTRRPSARPGSSSASSVPTAAASRTSSTPSAGCLASRRLDARGRVRCRTHLKMRPASHVAAQRRGSFGHSQPPSGRRR